MTDRHIQITEPDDYLPEPPHDRFDGALLCALCSLTSAIRDRAGAAGLVGAVMTKKSKPKAEAASEFKRAYQAYRACIADLDATFGGDDPVSDKVADKLFDRQHAAVWALVAHRAESRTEQRLRISALLDILKEEAEGGRFVDGRSLALAGAVWRDLSFAD